MMNSVTLLCHKQSTQKSLRKVLQALFSEPPFSIFDLPQAPNGIDEKEFLVSEAMKLACNGDQLVFIIGVDKKETIEQDIPCNRFESLIKFLPQPFILVNVFSMQASFNTDGDLVCEKKCSVFGDKGQQLCSGRVLERQICHEIKNILPLAITEDDLEKFAEITDRLGLLEMLFIPEQEKQRIDRFVSKLESVRLFAQEGNIDLFKKNFTAFKNNKDFLRGFPHIGGGAK